MGVMNIFKKLEKPETSIVIVYILLIAYCIVAGLFGIFGEPTPYSWMLTVASVLTTAHAVVLFVIERLKRLKGSVPMYISLGLFITGTYVLFMSENVRVFGMYWYGIVYDTLFYLFVLAFLSWRASYVREALRIAEFLKKGGDKK